MLIQLRKISLFVGTGILVFLAIIVISQTVQLVQFGQQIHPNLGYGILVFLLILYTLFILIPIWLYLKLPSTLEPPAEMQGPEFDAYLKKLSRRLSKNGLLVGENANPKTRDEIEKALGLIDQKAEKIITEASSTIFISTAISQNGRLDALMVLGAQTRMVWQLAHLYHQRPHWREMVSLYNNVLVTTLLATQIEDLNLNERIEPVVRSALGSGLAGAVPGLNVAATILVAAVLEGTANAFLTLRVGMICRQYCRSLVKQERGTLCRNATLEAASRLGAIVMKATGVVSTAIAKATAKTGVGVVTKVGENVKDGADMIWKTGKMAGKAAVSGAESATGFITGTGKKIGKIINEEIDRGRE